jgi:hypothetical protein
VILNETTAKLVYSVLIDECGALPSAESAFTLAFTEENPPREFRINGKLGFGGKFRFPGMSVDCYPEDHTPARAVMMQQANDRLRSINEIVLSQPVF